MVVVNLMKIILVYHLLQVLLHSLLAEVVRLVGAAVVGDDLRVLQPHVSQLVAQRQPPRHAVVGTSEQLDLLTAGVHALDDAVDLVGLAAGLADLADDDVAVEAGVDEGLPLDADEAVLLGVVEPVAGLAGDDQPVDLVGLDPDQLVDPPVPPLGEALPRELHRPPGHPEEDEPLVLQDVHAQVEQLLVLECAVGQRHVDVPGRVGHYHVELPQDLEVEVAQVAVDPLGVRHAFAVDGAFLGSFELLVLLDVVDEFAVGVVAGVEVRAVAEGLVGVLVYDGAEVLLVAVRVPLRLLALVPRAVVAVLQVLLRLELHRLDLLRKADDVLQLSGERGTLASMSIFSAKREGALRRFSIICLCSFSLPESSFRCC
jgi:hypothetical protein